MFLSTSPSLGRHGTLGDPEQTGSSQLVSGCLKSCGTEATPMPMCSPQGLARLPIPHTGLALTFRMSRTRGPPPQVQRRPGTEGAASQRLPGLSLDPGLNLPFCALLRSAWWCPGGTYHGPTGRSPKRQARMSFCGARQRGPQRCQGTGPAATTVAAKVSWGRASAPPWAGHDPAGPGLALRPCALACRLHGP